MLTDLRYAFRMLLKSPGFTFVAIITLALGIGANTAIFSVVDAVLVKPLPLFEPQQLVQVWESKKYSAGFQGTSSAANVRDWREQNTVFSGLAAYRDHDFALQGNESPERLVGALVSANYFQVMGAQPLLGRTFAKSDDEAGGSAVAVLSEGLWRVNFAADPAIVGRTVSLDERRFTVVGVMPASFRFPYSRNQVWTPLVISAAEMAARGNHSLEVVGRLRPGITLAQARAQMGIIANGIAKKFPDEQADRGVKLVPLHEELTGANRTSLLVLLGSVACVLLIATTNIANLLLARTAGRQREIALRLALGASRRRLVRQFLTESLLLAALGGGAGMITAIWGIDLFASLLGTPVVRAGGVQLNGTVLLFTALLTLLVGIACGLAPARQAVGRSARNLQLQLHGQTAVAGVNRLRSFLVITEVMLAVLLLSGAGLLLHSFAQLQRTDSGLAKPEQVLTARLSFPGERYGTSAAITSFFDRLLERAHGLPSVRDTGAISLLPLGEWGMNGEIEIKGRAPFPPGQAPLVEFRAVAGNYFPTMGVPLLAGRLLDRRDRGNAPPAVVINRTLARRIAAKESEAVGEKIGNGPNYTFTIVGVVADVRQSGLDRPPRPELYFPIAQAPLSEGSGENSMTLVVRAVGQNPRILADSLRRAVGEVDPTLPLFQIETLDGVIAQSIADRRLNGLLLGTFAAVALALAALGLYGVLSYAVTQRTRELGVRLALGAQRGDLFRLVVGGGMKLAAIGIALGLVASFGLTRLLTSLLYGIGPNDPLTFGAVVALLALVALLANYIPARRAMKVDPMEALRYE